MTFSIASTTPSPRRSTGRDRLLLGGNGRRLCLDGLELGRQGDFDELEIVRMRYLSMADARRLMDARAALGWDPADALAVELHPTSEAVTHPEGAVVLL